MIPTVTPPTDNIYKFGCIFGVAIIIACIFSFTSVYNASLAEKVKYATTVDILELKQNQNTKLSEEETITLKNSKLLLKITKSNEDTAMNVIGFSAAIGLLLCFFGGCSWYKIIQKRDDIIASLQNQKAEKELDKLNLEIQILQNQLNDTNHQPSVSKVSNFNQQT